MKKLMILGIVITMLLSLCACSIDVEQTEYELPEPRFICLESTFQDEAYIIVDTETGVQYLFRKYMNAGGMTVLLDEDGKPLLYEESEDK